MDFNGAIGTNHNNDCKVAGSCSFGGGNSRPTVTTSNTRVNGQATFNADFNGSIDNAYISNCQQEGSCRFGGKKKRHSINVNQISELRFPYDQNCICNGHPGSFICIEGKRCQCECSKFVVYSPETLSRGKRNAQFDIKFNGPVGSHQTNDCSYPGACTDQTLANPNNQYPNTNQTPNNQNPNNQTPNNQYGGSHSGFNISINGPIGSTHDNDCNHAGACTDQTLENGGLGNTGQGTIVIGFTEDQEIVQQPTDSFVQDCQLFQSNGKTYYTHVFNVYF